MGDHFLRRPATGRRLAAIIPAAALAACATALVPGSGSAATRTRTLRFFDKPVSMQLTHADGTVVTRAPFPEAVPGDVLDVHSLAYRGDHAHHARRWTASTHLRCTFAAAGPPACESHVAIGGSMLMFAGDPGTVTGGTGSFEGATGRVLSSDDAGRGASDVVVKVRLRR